VWHLEGFDPFDNSYYPLEGDYESEEDAIDAGYERLDYLEETQPSASSGGQSLLGIQDRVYVISPDGAKYRLRKP
jgi:hypothetical protein